MNLNEWSLLLKSKAATHDARVQVALAESGIIVKASAKANIGHLQPEKGPFQEWHPLASSTIKEKQRLGFDFNPDHNPLLRTNRLRESIQLAVYPRRFVVGSGEDIAVYQEYGTATIPPRPFIRPAMFQNLLEIGGIIGVVYMESFGAKLRGEAHA